MASLKELRNRIASVKATRKITKAMQMVAASKLNRAQEAVRAARPYAERMDQIVSNLAANASGDVSSPYMVGTGFDQTHLLVVATADRGLCGGFNANISKLARQHAARLMAEGRNVKILCVGSKGADVLRRDFADKIIDVMTFRDAKVVGFDNADEVGAKVRALFEAGEFDIATLFYAEFKSVIAQEPTAQQLIPASIPPIDDGDAPAASGSVEYEYEPSEEEILVDLLPRNISTQIFNALLENAASEQGARMSAMDNATRNAGDMIDKLTVEYNRSRQAKITTELIEIISGAEAL
ncbi:MAG: F0F1 ATP synthase subunit gamma [Pseudomonadota bacterium]